VVGEDTHLTGGSGDVDLGTVVAQGSSVIFSGSEGGHDREGNAHAGGAVDGL
jgi:hypothetical protein